MSLILRPIFSLFLLSSFIGGCQISKTANSFPPVSDNPSPTSTPTVNYYIDYSGGNNNNAGTSEESAWKTLSHLNDVALASGSTIYLKKGEVWNEELVINKAQLTIDSYGNGANPVLDGSSPLTGWQNEGNGIYSAIVPLSTGEGLGNIQENSIMMNFLPWKDNFAQTFSGAATSSFSFDYGSNKIYILPAGIPSDQVYRVSKKLYGIKAVSVSEISVKNISIRNFSLHGIFFKNCMNCNVESVEISNGGGAVIGPNSTATSNYLYAGNGIEYDTGSSGTVTDVKIDSIFDSGISPQTYESNQTISGINILNATISKCGFAGIEISVLSNGGSTNSSISQITVNNNTVIDSGKGWSRRRYGTEGNGVRIFADQGAGSMTGIALEGNSISNNLGDGIQLSGQIGVVSLHREKINNNGNYGIKVADANPNNLRLLLTSSLITNNGNYGIYFNSPSGGGFHILHNTFYSNTSIHIGVFGQSSQAKIINNIFDSASPMTNIYSAMPLMGVEWNYNCYINSINMLAYNNIPYSSLSSFATATDFDRNSVAGNISMQNPMGGEYTLMNTSSCKNTGLPNAGVLYDFNHSPLSTTQPSMGAFQ